MTQEKLPHSIHLVQRLNKPFKKTGGPLDKLHHAIGGGMMAIGKELWDIIDGVFSLDYMGSAEFEYGAFPRALETVAKDAKKLNGFVFQLKREDVPENPSRRWVSRKKEAPPPPPGPFEIYVLCRKSQNEAVMTAIKDVVQGKFRLKESARMDETLDPIEEWHGRTVGWFNLDNGFFWFTDKEMWKGTLELFGLEAPQ